MHGVRDRVYISRVSTLTGSNGIQSSMVAGRFQSLRRELTYERYYKTQGHRAEMSVK